MRHSPKLIPWFVSDVTPPDFKSTIPSLSSESFFNSSNTSIDPKQHEHLQKMVTRWQSYLDSGVFALSVPVDTALGQSHPKVSSVTLTHPRGKINQLICVFKGDFWTGPWPYWDLQEKAPELWEDLKGSSLVIFKVC